MCVVLQVSVNRTTPFSQAQKNGLSGSAYITYLRPEDALRCIEAVDGVVWEGKTIKACFGTTKYCNAYLKGLPCSNSDCLYLHEVADAGDSFSKDDMLADGLAHGAHTGSMCDWQLSMLLLVALLLLPSKCWQRRLQRAAGMQAWALVFAASASSMWVAHRTHQQSAQVAPRSSTWCTRLRGHGAMLLAAWMARLHRSWMGMAMPGPVAWEAVAGMQAHLAPLGLQWWGQCTGTCLR